MGAVLGEDRAGRLPVREVAVVEGKEQDAPLAEWRRVAVDNFDLADRPPDLEERVATLLVVDKPLVPLADADALDLAVGAVPEDDVVGAALLGAADGIGLKRLEAAVLEEDVPDPGVAVRHPDRYWAFAFKRDAVADANVLDIDVLPFVDPRRGEAETDGRLVEAAVVD